MRYSKDKNDTEELFRQNIASVEYENTIETAYPQTDLYGIIEGHFRSALPQGKTEKKVAIIGIDGCRADFVFIIYENTDSAGHDFGFSFNNPIYKNAFNKEDAYGYEVIKAIESRETCGAEDRLIIVTSDHGGLGTWHGSESIQERMIFVVMNKDWN